jgi:O-antigen ligase
MNSWKSSLRVAFAGALCVAVVVCMVIARPEYLTNVEYLGGFLFLEVLAAILWNYRRRFFPALILVFLLAGTDAKLQDVWSVARWLVLGAGALVGMAIYVKDHSVSSSSSRLFHWIAFSCVVSAAISAEVSTYPKQPLLKALSLFLLFLYGSFGAKLAVMQREGQFISGLLWGCEMLVYFVAVEYFVLRHQFFGNPNSLGAVMGVAIVPLMLWGSFHSKSAWIQRRRTLALLLSMALLFASYSRASIFAATASCILLCVLSRRYHTLVRGLGLGLLIAAVVVSFVPLPNSPAAPTFRSRFLYKGKEQGGVLGSRRSVWDTTIASVELHPWFGTGFGTVLTAYDSRVNQGGTFESNSETTREHGDSYLAIVEGVGLVGVIPFFFLLVLILVNIRRVLIQLWSTKDLSSPAVPMALVLVAGLVDAMFEDWLFAVGYYVCVFFWALAFMLVNLAPRLSGELAPSDLPPIHVSPENAMVSLSR